MRTLLCREGQAPPLRRDKAAAACTEESASLFVFLSSFSSGRNGPSPSLRDTSPRRGERQAVRGRPTPLGKCFWRNVEVLRSFYRSWGQELEGQDSPPESFS